MENELKDVNPEPSKPRQPEPQPETANDNASNRDDRPLLKSDSKGMSTANIEDLEKKFAAFVRNDVYGTMGRGELPLAEKALLGFALVTLLPIRVMLAMIILFFYYSVCRICTLFSAPNRDVEEEQEDFAHMGGWSRAVIVRCGSFVSRVMLFLFGFYWIRESYRILEQPQNKSFTQVIFTILSSTLCSRDAAERKLIDLNSCIILDSKLREKEMNSFIPKKKIDRKELN